MNDKLDQRKKGYKPSNFKNQQKKPTQVEKQPATATGENPKDPQQNKGPLQCWKCVGSQLCRYYPLQNENARPAYNIQEAEMVVQVARAIPRIYAALEDN